MTYGQLPEQIRQPGPRAFLYCPTCGAEYSATRGDYFQADPDAPIKCCRRNMVLVTARRVLTEVQA